MERWADDDGVQALFEIFTASQRLILKSLDYQGVRFTKYQIYLLIVLSRKKSMTMSQAAASLGCSKEQATRLVAALVEAGYIERLHSEENRKLVMIRLTKEGAGFIRWERSMVWEKLKKDLGCLDQEEMEQFFSYISQLAPLLRKVEEQQERTRKELEQQERARRELTHQERTRRELEHEIYRKHMDGTAAGGSAETKVVR